MGKSNYDNRLEKLDLDFVQSMAEQGWTPREMALEIGVCEVLFSRWCRVSPELNEIVKTWRDYADAAVERALHESARGFKRTKTTFFAHQGQVIETRQTIEQDKPDAAALKFYLSNKLPDKYRERREHQIEQSGEVTLRWFVDDAEPPDGWLDD